MDGAGDQHINNGEGADFHVHDLTIDKPGGTCYLESGDLHIVGDLLISDGTLSCDNGPSPTATYNIKIEGDWTNNVGTDGFDESTGMVTFYQPLTDGSKGHQYVSNEEFNILEISKWDGGALRLDGTTVTCNSYLWTYGALDVLSGTFTALDLRNQGLYGSFYTNPGGYIHLHQDASSYIDLNGHLIFSGGGEIHVYGGALRSYWPFYADASITMNGGGVLDFHDNGIYVFQDPDQTFTATIDNGTIRTAGGFESNRADFTPVSGSIELYGPTTADLELYNGSTLNDVVINKAAKDGTSKSSTGPVYDTRSGEMISDGSRATLVNLGSDVTITHDLLIETGSFDLNGYLLNVGHDVIVNDGTLVMEDPVDVMNVGNEVIWNSGSSELVTEGTINLDYRMIFYDGSNVQLGDNNVLNLLGSSTAIRNFSALAEIGMLNIDMTPAAGSVCYVSYTTTQPVHVVGNMNVEEDNRLEIQEYDLIVDGVADIKAGATVNLGSPLGGGYFESNGELILNGTLSVDFEEALDNTKHGSIPENSDLAPGAISPGDNTDWVSGEVFAHGEFSLESGGTLNILGGGSFIWDTPYVSGIVPMYGTLNLDDGLFEASHRNISMSGTFNINGGTIRAGRTMTANSAANFQPSGGLVEFVGTSTGSYIQISNGNYFNNVRIDRTASILLHSGSILDIRGDLTIDGGGLNSNDLPIYIGGHWMNNVGPDAFDEGTGTVTFNGTWVQECSGEEFYNLVLDKPNGDFALFNGQTVTCQSYQWIGGAIYVTQGTFTALDLVDNGIFGTYFTAGPNATINLYQDAVQFVDLNGFIRIDDGEMNIFGGSESSYWPYDADAELQLSGGILDFVDNGIYINENLSYSLTTNITGGIIRTSGEFFGFGNEFTPAGGSVVLYGENTALAGFAEASHFHHLVINKSEPSDNSINPTTYTDRNGKIIENTRAALVISNYDFTIEGSLYVNQGTFSTNNNTVQVNEDAIVAMGGTLNIDEGSGLLLSGSSTLEVNDGGLVEVLGAEGNPATVSHSAGYYSFDVKTGGMISANYGIFEYMGTLFGIRVRDGGFVDLVNSFDNCQFKNGNAGLSNGALLSIYNSQTLTINNASFPTVGTDYNVGKALNKGYLTFMDYTGAFSGEDYDLDPNDLIEWYEPQLSANPTTINVLPLAGSTSFDITSNVDWTVSEGSTWLSVDPTTGSNNATVTINYDQNTSFTPRYAELTVSAPDVPDVIVTVNQAAAGAILSVSPPNQNVGPAAGATSFSILSNTGWTVTESVPWMNVAPMSGTGNGLMNASYGENTTGSMRVGSVTVTATGGSPSQTVTVTQATYPTHSISLTEGWSGLSSYIMPANNAIEDVFAPVSGEFIIAQTMTQMFYPTGPVNTIIDWASQSAYKLKMDAAATLPIIGYAETNKTLSMGAGWSLIPVICNYPVDAATTLSPLNLEIAKDVAGTGVLWPDMSINTLGMLTPGMAYYVLLNSGGSFTYPPNSGESTPANPVVLKLPDHPWNSIENSSSSHIIAIVADGMQEVLTGDIIGVSAPDGKCYGVSEIISDEQNIALSAFVDDVTTDEKDGFSEGEPFSFNLYRPETNEVFDLEAVFNPNMPNGMFFANEGLSAISNLKLSSTGISGASASGISIYPNPTNDRVWISGIEEFSEIEVLSNTGKMLLKLSNDGKNETSIDMTAFSNGIYQLKLTGNKSTAIRKIIKN